MSPSVARFLRWRQRPSVSLEEAVLSPRPWRYARWRLRFLVLRAVLLAGAHLCEVTFFYDIFAVRYFVSVLGLYYAYTFGAALWWGALEPARREVRSHLRAGEPGLAARALRPWLALSLALALVVLLIAVGLIAARMRRTGVFSVFDLSTAALMGRLALELVLRAYQAGVQATRRVYRPIWLVVGLDVIDVLGVVLLWPWLGPFSFGAVYCGTALASTVLMVHYTARAQRRSPLAALPLWSRRVGWSALRAHAGAALAYGVANGLGRADGVMLVWLLLTRVAPQQGIAIAAMLHLGAPVLHLCLAWPRPYAIDVAWQGVGMPALLRRRFRLQLLWVAPAVALFATALALIVIASLVPLTPATTRTLPLLFPVGLLWALCARAQVLAFMEGRALLAALASLVPTGGLLAVVWTLVTGAGALAVVAIAATLLATWWLSRAVRRPRQLYASPVDRLLAPLALFHRVSSWEGETWLALLQVDRGLVSSGARLGRTLARQYQDTAVSLLEDGLIAMAAPVTARAAPRTAQLAGDAAGLARAVQVLEAPSGAAALVEAIKRGELGVEWSAAWRAPASPCDDARARSSYQRAIPAGVVLSARAGGLPLGPGSGSLARALLRALRAHVAGRRRGSRAGRWELTAYAPHGEPRMIFATPLEIDTSRRREWRDQLAALQRGALTDELRRVASTDDGRRMTDDGRRKSDDGRR